MEQNQTSEEIISAALDNLKSIFLPTYCNLLKSLDMDEMMDAEGQLIFKNQTMRLWVRRFMNDEIDRLKQISTDSDDDSVAIEMARIYAMGVISSSYDHIMSSIKKLIEGDEENGKNA